MTADPAEDVTPGITDRDLRTAERRPAQTAPAPGPRPVPAPAQPPTTPPPEPTPPEQAPAAKAQPGGAQQASGNGWVVPLCVLIIGMFMSVLDTSIVNVAIPKMQTALSASVDDIEWVVTGYTLALGVIVPLSGWLGQRFGLTRMYVGSMLGFALGSALCGLAWNLNSMVGFRILQALPGGVLPVITLTLLYQIVPPAKIGSAMGLYGLGVVVAPAIGPTLGGYLVEYFDWRLIFFINVPIGIAGTVLALMIFPQIKPTTWPKLDILGFVTIAYALFAMLLAFSEGEDWGWTGFRILGLFTSAALSLALFFVIENEVDNPLIDLRVFRSFPFCRSLALLSITITTSSRWLMASQRDCTRPTCALLFIGRVPRMVMRARISSPTITGLSHFRLSSPGEPRLLESSRKPSHISRITMPAVCQPLAASPPNSEALPASSLR